MISLVSRSSKMILVGVAIIIVLTIITLVVWQQSRLTQQTVVPEKTIKNEAGVVPPVVLVDPNTPPEPVVPPVVPAETNGTTPLPVTPPAVPLPTTVPVTSPNTTSVTVPVTAPNTPSGSGTTTPVVPPLPLQPQK